MVADQGIFKSSVFGGFDRQSVLTYVDELMAKGQEREAVLQRRVEELSEERDRLSGQVLELTQRAETFEERLKKAEEGGQDAAKKDMRIAELEKQSARANEQLSLLNATLAKSEDKGRKYDAVAAQVGVVMVEAQKQADTILARARQQADDITQESIDNIYDFNKRVDDVKNGVYRLRSFAAETLQSFDEQLSRLEMAIKDTQGQLYLSAGDMGAGMQHPPYDQAAQGAPPIYDEPRPRSEGNDFFAPPYQG